MNLVTEAHVQQTVTEFLQLDGWRPIRTDPVSDRKRGKGFGEVGMPDYLFIRYEFYKDFTVIYRRPVAEVLWIEFKRKGKDLKPHQATWHDNEVARGAAVLVVDDIDGFISWYGSSGLARYTVPSRKVK